VGSISSQRDHLASPLPESQNPRTRDPRRSRPSISSVRLPRGGCWSDPRRREPSTASSLNRVSLAGRQSGCQICPLMVTDCTAAPAYVPR
jgi:hypothetical protein